MKNSKWKFQRKILPVEPPLLLAVGGGFGAACVGAGLPLWCCIFPVALLFFLGKRDILIVLSSFLLCAGTACWNSYSIESCEAEYSRAGRYSGVLTIRDNRATRQPGAVLKSRCRAEFQRDGAECAIAVAAAFPETLSEKGMLYGDRFKVEGVLIPTGVSGFYFDRSGIGDAVPPPYGNDHLFRVIEVEELPEEKSVKRLCFRLRELFLRRLLLHLPTGNGIASMAARLFLGASDGAPPELKEQFVLSGIIHLFAVSGMHVGILALIAGVILRPLPLKVRGMLLAAVTLLYVSASGMALPALRAGMMISVWCILRAYSSRSSTSNILFLAFFAVCLTDPLSIGELGLQYSFGVTAVLIYGMKYWSEYRRDLMWKSKLMPGGAPLTRKYFAGARLKEHLAMPLFIALLAFTASAMLTVHRQGWFLPGSIVTNLAVALVTPLLFILFLLKMFANWIWTGVDVAVGKGIGTGFEILSGCAGISLEIFEPLPSAKLSGNWVLLFYLLLFGGLFCKGFYCRLGLAAASLLLLTGVTVYGNYRKPARMIVCSSGSGKPAALAYLPEGETRALVCDVPDSFTGVLAAQELRFAGAGSAELFFSGGYSGNNAGVNRFDARLPVERVHLPEKKNSFYFRKNLNMLKRGELSSLPDRRRPVKSADGTLCWSPERDLVISSRETDSGREITVRRNGKTVSSLLMPWSNRVLIWKIEL